MAKCEVTYACGHTGTVELYGKSSLREWRLKSISQQICPDCAEEERKLKNLQCQEENRKSGLPELLGTEKQVLWAESIRKDLVADYENKAEETLLRCHQFREEAEKKGEDVPSDAIIVESAVDYVGQLLYSEQNASWFIDNRDRDADDLLLKAAQGIKDKKLSPFKFFTPASGAMKPGAVEISRRKEIIVVKYPKDDDLIQLMHELEFCWRDGWQRGASIGSGALDNLAAYTADRLLELGFSVRIQFPAAVDRLEAGAFEPVNPREIYFVEGDKEGFRIYFDSDEIKNLALTLPGAYERKWYVKVGAHSALEVEDFAKTHNFVLSASALKQIEIRKNAEKEKIAPRCIRPRKEADKPETNKEGVILDLVDD